MAFNKEKMLRLFSICMFISACATESPLPMILDITADCRKPVDAVIGATLLRCSEGALSSAL